LTTSVNSRWPNVHKGYWWHLAPQAPGDATVPKRFFRDNFVIFRRKSKRILVLESMNFSTCVYMQIFNFRDGHVTTFQHPLGAYICQMPGHRLSRLAKGTPSESRFSIGTVPLVWGKTVSCRLCAGRMPRFFECVCCAVN